MGDVNEDDSIDLGKVTNVSNSASGTSGAEFVSYMNHSYNDI